MILERVPLASSSSDLRARSEAIEAIYAVAHSLLSREMVAEAAKGFRIMLRFAPDDERGWIGLGTCHERVQQPHVALELYGTGSIAASRVGTISVRCLLAMARLLFAMGREVDSVFVDAERAARAAG